MSTQRTTRASVSTEIPSSEIIAAIDIAIEKALSRHMALLSTKISALEEVVRQKDIVIAEQGDNITKQAAVILRMEERLQCIYEQHDSLDQYGRRMCIRVDNIPVVEGETQVDVQASVLATLQAAGADVKAEDVVRLHRVGKTAPKDIRGRNINVSQVIIKVNSWRARESAHNARNAARERGNPIRQDLTMRRRELLQLARARIDELTQHGPRNPPVYAYANINCVPTIRCGNRSRKFINEDEMDDAFGYLNIE